MAGFAAQPDEGYSEAPLTALSTSTSFLYKTREDAVSSLGAARQGTDFPAWLTQHISNLSLPNKTELAMALLSDLPTSVIAEIVEQLNPRLYIDFIQYLPPEVCLKILGFLDPTSLINLARSCRTWYDLALDRKLWENLYYMEGWKAKPDEIAAWEQNVNRDSISSGRQLQRVQSEEYGHAHKKRSVAMSPTTDGDVDMVMIDAETALRHEPADMDMAGSSIFGDPSSVRKTGISQRMSDLDMKSTLAATGYPVKGVDKGKGRAFSPTAAATTRVNGESVQNMIPSQALPKATLWMWDGNDQRFKMNWRYIYTIRRRLESNWEHERYTNFQLPHPDHPEEGHGECIYSLQFNPKFLVSGSRDRTLKIWDLDSRRCLRTLAKHRGSVLCLQFDSDPDEDIIVSGSSDSNVIIWRFSTGEVLQTLDHAHRESVLNVKFDKRILVTCSKDKTIKIFNRKPLRYGDLGYKEVDPVPQNIKNYGYALNISPEDLPQTPPWTEIGCLEGHSAAVNAVQIHEREIVSASGDRHIKVWDWPTQACTRTIVGHTKGIACVQYDGRRIVSGSSDNEVKVFDRQTGLEVASLRSHSSLVRTVQAGFGDLPYSVDEDAAEAKKVDSEYFKAVESGRLEEKDHPRTGRRQANAGSRRPEDICAYGAKLPPGGGGGKYGRIVSGSYDTTIIIWRRDKEGVWKAQHHLKQEEGAVAAIRQGRTQASIPGNIPLHPSMRESILSGAIQFGGAPPATPAPGSRHVTMPAGIGASSLSTTSAQAAQPTSAPPSTPAPSNSASASAMQINSILDTPLYNTISPSVVSHYQQMIDHAVQNGHQNLARALAAHPPMLSQRVYIEAAIDRQASPVVRSQLRQAFTTALFRAQFDHTRQLRENRRNPENALAGGSGTGLDATPTQGQSQNRPADSDGASAQPGSQADASVMAAVAAATAAHQAHSQLHAPAHGVHLHQVPSPASLPSVQSPSPSQPAPNAPVQHRSTMARVSAEVLNAANNPARVFKLQYDARRIICCSQTSVIVGWDFCNGDPELEEASRFFASVQ
ncbi:hypothetical protein B0T19DRAFT_287070 [Cercophora scortea]|uniref:F-box domain-containing protein n=1 Tax=Cercophora scortea TaxID=314031 RepID=A0AAE0I2D8_9PEZI|nr:hypothetical protein B0T19DRAFT_287070 [Cercophora scortea]